MVCLQRWLTDKEQDKPTSFYRAHAKKMRSFENTCAMRSFCYATITNEQKRSEIKINQSCSLKKKQAKHESLISFIKIYFISIYKYYTKYNFDDVETELSILQND